jgi:hypothetical protein
MHHAFDPVTPALSTGVGVRFLFRRRFPPVVSLLVETEDLVSASAAIERRVIEPLADSLGWLWARLYECGAMAGNDPGGLAWAAEYDRGARAAHAGMIDVLKGCSSLAAMFAQTAYNYAAADAASTPGGAAEALRGLVPVRQFGVAVAPPSAAGGSGGGPPGWGMVEHFVGYVWPDGHQDRLHAAAAAWRASADALRANGGRLTSVLIPAGADRLPEYDDMHRVCSAMSNRMDRLAAVHTELADGCEQLARHIDDVHSAVTDELWDLLEWTAGIEAAGALLSIVSFGASEGGAQSAESARIGKTAAAIAALIERFIAAVRAVAASVGTIAARADEIAGELVGLTDLRLSYAVVSSVKAMPMAAYFREFAALNRVSEAARGLPALAVPLAQLRRKFKHAREFGVLLNNSKAGWEAFDGAVTSFVEDGKTTRIAATRGRYRDAPAILNYNGKSRLVVIQHPDGEFWSCWRMSPEQLIHVRRFGTLSRG